MSRSRPICDPPFSQTSRIRIRVYIRGPDHPKIVAIDPKLRVAVLENSNVICSTCCNPPDRTGRVSCRIQNHATHGLYESSARCQNVIMATFAGERLAPKSQERAITTSSILCTCVKRLPVLCVHTQRRQGHPRRLITNSGNSGW